MHKLVLATGNPHKVVEILPVLKANGIEGVLQTDFFADEVEEDGLSYVENALKKARFASAKTGLPALADDSGLSVDALSGQPGIYSARFAEGYQGQSASDELNNQKLLALLEGLPFEQRKACYICTMVYVEHELDPTPIIATAKWCGEILMEPRTAYGIGYDPLVWMSDHFKVAADIPLEIKNTLGHRGKALQEVLAKIKEVVSE